jgi:hypothetical protein
MLLTDADEIGDEPAPVADAVDRFLAGYGTGDR